MSRTVVNYPIVAALTAAEKILGPNRQWETTNQKQVRFLKEFFELCRNEDVPEIKSVASWQAEIINEFLSERGFSFRLQPLAPNMLGVASVLDLLVKWSRKGKVIKIETDTKERFPGVRIEEENVRFFRVSGRNEPIACVATKSGDKVFMTMTDEVDRLPPDDFDFAAKIAKWSNGMWPISDFGGLRFPMVDLDQKVNISWLHNLQTTCEDGNPAIISQALQETRLKMNEIGARVQSAVTICTLVTAVCTPRRPDYIINRPFLIWFSRDGLKKSLFVGHITQKDWRNPKSLD